MADWSAGLRPGVACSLKLRRVGDAVRLFTFNLLPSRLRPTIQAMFDTITAELATAADKLAHLRRFL